MVKFKDKEYQLKMLFVRQEAALAKQLQRLSNEDLEIKADAMIKACVIMTGVDEGDLNGSTLDEVNSLMRSIMAERSKGLENKDEAQETGKAVAVP